MQGSPHTKKKINSHDMDVHIQKLKTNEQVYLVHLIKTHLIFAQDYELSQW